MDNGRVALVTGSSRGLGRAIVRELAEHGCAVVINYHKSSQPAQELQAELLDKGARVICVQANVADQEDARRLVDTTVKELGGIDILVNNAGIKRDRAIRLMKADEWRAVLSADLDSVFYCTNAASAHMMRRRNGHIVNIASTIGQMGNVGQANYAAAKAGVIGFTKAAALELARFGIAVNAICPGYIETELVSDIPESARAEALSRIPAGRFGTPEEVARLCRFLVLESSYITGAQLNINGGLYL